MICVCPREEEEELASQTVLNPDRFLHGCQAKENSNSNKQNHMLCGISGAVGVDNMFISDLGELVCNVRARKKSL